MRRFDEAQLIDQLTDLEPHCALAFAASICARMVPTYLKFQEETGWGDKEALAHAVEVGWDVAEGKSPTHDLATLRERCEAAAPDTSVHHSDRSTAAQDACFAVCYLLDCVSRLEPAKIARIASFARDSVDLFVQEAGKMDPQDRNLEDRICSHELMQRELQRQHDDLAALSGRTNFSDAFAARFRRDASRNDRRLLPS